MEEDDRNKAIKTLRAKMERVREHNKAKESPAGEKALKAKSSREKEPKGRIGNPAGSLSARKSTELNEGLRLPKITRQGNQSIIEIYSNGQNTKLPQIHPAKKTSKVKKVKDEKKSHLNMRSIDLKALQNGKGTLESTKKRPLSHIQRPDLESKDSKQPQTNRGSSRTKNSGSISPGKRRLTPIRRSRVVQQPSLPPKERGRVPASSNNPKSLEEMVRSGLRKNHFKKKAETNFADDTWIAPAIEKLDKIAVQKDKVFKKRKNIKKMFKMNKDFKSLMDISFKTEPNKERKSRKVGSILLTVPEIDQYDPKVTASDPVDLNETQEDNGETHSAQQEKIKEVEVKSHEDNLELLETVKTVIKDSETPKS